MDSLKKSKSGLEKAKNTLEGEMADMSAELKAAMASKQENERRRKQLESQNAELSMKMSEAEKSHGENQDKYSKILTELEAMATALSEAENKASISTRNQEGLTSQLAEATTLFEDETRQKLQLQSKLKAMEKEKEVMAEQLEEEEEGKLSKVLKKLDGSPITIDLIERKQCRIPKTS